MRRDRCPGVDGPLVRVLAVVVSAVLVSVGAAAAAAPGTPARPAGPFGSTLHVDDDAPAGGDGQTWATAYRHLQDALDFAAVVTNGIAEIRIAGGTYRPDRDALSPLGSGDRYASFTIERELDVRGGFAGVGAADPDLQDPGAFETVLDGDLLGDDGPNFANIDDNSFHVVTMIDVGRAGRLEAVTVRGGSDTALSVYDPDPGRLGAGLWLQECRVRLENLLVRDHWINGTGANPSGRGAGLFVDGGAPLITRCAFVHNRSEEGGTGVYSTGSPLLRDCFFIENTTSTSGFGPGGGFRGDDGAPELLRCVFRDNFADGDGGGVWQGGGAITLIDCTFEDNVGDSGGGGVEIMSAVFEVRGCTFINNDGNSTGFSQGGGLSASGAGLIAGCLFEGNLADAGGGMTVIPSGDGDPRIDVVGCVVRNNACDQNDGGGINAFSPGVRIAGCIVTGNFADEAGGGIYGFANGYEVVNSVVAYNTAGEGAGLVVGAGGSAVVRNTILWGNGNGTEADQVRTVSSGVVDVAYSCIQGLTGALGGAGNIANNPQFVDPFGPDGEAGTADDDLHLGPGSRCVDAGDNGAVMRCLLDLDGLIRYADDPATPDGGAGIPPIVDIGPYELASLPAFDCDGDVLDDGCATSMGLRPDCNDNGTPDACDVVNGTGADCNANGVPDECKGIENDCNGNGVPDDCDVVAGAAVDCNRNGIPDDCDITSGESLDCNGDDVPDECELDCNGNGIPDVCDLASGTSNDGNLNDVPDECEQIVNLATGSRHATIAHAIAGAFDGNVIEVAAGTYRESFSFQGKAVRLRSAGGAAATIVLGDGTQPVVSCVDGEGPRTVLQGFTITGGGGPFGGGMFNDGSSPTVLDCVFLGNTVDLDGFNGRGGGMYNFGGSSPLVGDCLFVGNTARAGGGMYNDDDCNPTVVECIFSGNVAQGNDNGSGVGGGMVNISNAPLIQRCQFLSNRADDALSSTALLGGGGMYIAASFARLVACRFEGNTTNRNGGAVSSAVGWEQYERCLFKDNTAERAAGGLAFRDVNRDLLLQDCLIVGNTCVEEGGGVHTAYGSNARFVNCTITGNSAAIGGGAYHEFLGFPIYRSCIIWGNTGAGGDLALGFTTEGPIVRYCDVGGGFDGPGNFDADPMFTNPAAGNFRPLPGSPAIDAGDPVDLAELGPRDLDGERRVLSCRVDVGPYETLGTGADCNGNGTSDPCEILDGSVPDCDDNGVPDGCDIAAGTADCNGNGIPDGCEIAPVVRVASGRLAPFDSGQAYDVVLPDVRPAIGDVVFELEGIADLNTASGVRIDINGQFVDRVLGGLDDDCPDVVVPDVLVLPADLFNAYLGDRRDAVITLRNEGCCSECSNSFVSLRLAYPTASTDDCDGSGGLDACETASGIAPDCNGNGIPDECDVDPELFVAAAYTPIGDTVPAQLVVVDPPTVTGPEVEVTFRARADIGSTNEFMDVLVNGVYVWTVFDTGATDCAEPPIVATRSMPAADFLALTGGGDIVIDVMPDGVSHFSCQSNNYLVVELRYVSVSPFDVDGDGVVDGCP